MVQKYPRQPDATLAISTAYEDNHTTERFNENLTSAAGVLRDMEQTSTLVFNFKNTPGGKTADYSGYDTLTSAASEQKAKRIAVDEISESKQGGGPSANSCKITVYFAPAL